jgi:threonine dehydrogenase-like Zn-dependent dehydrogenase
VVLKSTYGAPVELPLAQVVVDEIRLQGSRCGPFPPALRLLADGLVDPRPLIGEVLPLRQALKAFERAARPGAGKLLLAPGLP